MRMLLPPVHTRRVIDRALSNFFIEYRNAEFRRAVSLLCQFYRLKCPRFEWYQYIDWGKTAGKTYENGKIQLVHPEHWKRGWKYNSARHWINTVYHEMGHYVYWVDAEQKAIAFACRMVRGLSRREGRKTALLCSPRSSILQRGRKTLWQKERKRYSPMRTVGGSIKGKIVSASNPKSARR